MHNLIEGSDNYWKSSRSLRQYYRDIPVLENNIIDLLTDNNNRILFKFEEKTTWQTGNDSRKIDEIIVA